jgi:hypothetical protein
MKLNYFLVNVDTPINVKAIVILSTEYDASNDAYTAIQEGLKLGRIARVKTITPLTRKPHAKHLTPIQRCVSHSTDGQWGWIYQ